MPQDSNKSESNNQNGPALPKIVIGGRPSTQKNLNIPKENIAQSFSAPIIATLVQANQANTDSCNELERFAKNIGQAIKSKLNKQEQLAEIATQAKEILEKAKSNLETLNKAISNAENQLENTGYDDENRDALVNAINQAKKDADVTNRIIKSKEKQIAGLTSKLPKLEAALNDHNDAIKKMVDFQPKLIEVDAAPAKQKEILSEGKQHLSNAESSLSSLSKSIEEALVDDHKPIVIYQAEEIIENSRRTINGFRKSLTVLENLLSTQIEEEEKIEIKQAQPVDVTNTIVDPLNIARAANKEALQKLANAALLQPENQQTLESNLQNRKALLEKAKEAFDNLSAAIESAEKAKVDVDAETESQPFDKNTVDNALSEAQKELEDTRQAIKQHEELIAFQEATNPPVLEAYQNDIVLTERIKAQYDEFVEALKKPDNNESKQFFDNIHKLHDEIIKNNNALIGAMNKARSEQNKHPSNLLIKNSFNYIESLAQKVDDHAKQRSENLNPLVNQYATLKTAMQGDVNAQTKLKQAEVAFENAKKQIELEPNSQENKTNFNAAQNELQTAVNNAAISLGKLGQAIKDTEKQKRPQLDPLLNDAKKQHANSDEAIQRVASVINSNVKEIKIEKDDDNEFSKKPLPPIPSKQKAIDQDAIQNKLQPVLQRKNAHIEELKKLQPLLLSPITQEIKNELIKTISRHLNETEATLHTLNEIFAEAEENEIDVTKAKEQAEDFKKEINSFQNSLTNFQNPSLEINQENEDEVDVKNDNPKQEKKDKLDVFEMNPDKFFIALKEIENILISYDNYFKTMQTELTKQLESLKTTINEANQIYQIEHLTADLEKNKDEILARLQRKSIMLNDIKKQFDAIITEDGYLDKINKQLEKIAGDAYHQKIVNFANKLKQFSMQIQRTFSSNVHQNSNSNVLLYSALSAAQTEADKAIAFLSSDDVKNRVSYNVIPEHVYNPKTQTFTSHFVVASADFKDTQEIKLGIDELGYKKTKVETPPKPNEDNINEIKKNEQNGSILEFNIPQDKILDDNEKLQITINMMLDAIKSNPIDNKDNKLYIASTDESYLENCIMIAKALQISVDELDVQLLKNEPEGEFEESYSAKVSNIYAEIKAHNTDIPNRKKYEQIQGYLRAHKVSYTPSTANIIDENNMTAYSLREVRSNLADVEQIEKRPAQRKVERKRTFSPPTNLMALVANQLNQQSLDKAKTSSRVDKTNPIDARESIKKAVEINEKAKNETKKIEHEIEERALPKLR